MKRLVVLTAVCMLLGANVLAADPLAALVGVDLVSGQIIPSNSVASIQQLAAAAADAVAAQAAADAVATASQACSNRIDAIEGLIASQQQHAIFRGWVMSFSAAVTPVTNATCQIAAFSLRTAGTNTYADIAEWFTAAPTSAPSVRVRALLDGGSWGYATTVSNTWPNTVNVVTTGGVFACYQQTVLMPPAAASQFFRVDGAIQIVTGDSNILPIQGGLSVNGLVGLTTNIVIGGKTNVFVGGVLVTP